MKLRLLFLLFFASYITYSHAQTAVGTWSNTGPVLFPLNVTQQVNGIGRICQVKFHPSDPQKMYAVSASGGLFISSNNGLSWTVTGTDSLPPASCASVCIDPVNDSIIYLSTGDPDYYSSNNGYGIFKSVNGGISWSLMDSGIGNLMAVEMLIDPNDHNTIVAATNNGIWKSTNAGTSWFQTQSGTSLQSGGGFRSMLMRPGSSQVLYAVTSKEYFKSADFGSTWTQISNGLLIPQQLAYTNSNSLQCNSGLRLAVSAADTNVVYIATADSNGIIMRSNDGGQSFNVMYVDTAQCLVCLTQNPSSACQYDYNFAITANPQNANELLLAANCVWRSMDGGATWSKRTSWWNECHTDMHDIKFNPYNNQQIFNANDGGVWMSTDTLATVWQPRSDGLACTQIYHASQSPLIRQMADMGTQDNGELYFDNTWKCNRGNDWFSASAFDYRAGANVYYIQTGKRKALQPLDSERSYNSPFMPTNDATVEFLPSNSNIAFIGADSLWRSTNINTPMSK